MATPINSETARSQKKKDNGEKKNTGKVYFKHICPHNNFWDVFPEATAVCSCQQLSEVWELRGELMPSAHYNRAHGHFVVTDTEDDLIHMELRVRYMVPKRYQVLIDALQEHDKHNGLDSTSKTQSIKAQTVASLAASGSASVQQPPELQDKAILAYDSMYMVVKKAMASSHEKQVSGKANNVSKEKEKKVTFALDTKPEGSSDATLTNNKLLDKRGVAQLKKLIGVGTQQPEKKVVITNEAIKKVSKFAASIPDPVPTPTQQSRFGPVKRFITEKAHGMAEMADRVNETVGLKPTRKFTKLELETV